MKNLSFFLLVIVCFTSCMDRIDLRKFTIANNSNGKIYTLINRLDIEEDTINSYGFIGDFTDSLYSNKLKEINRPVDWGTYAKESLNHKFRLYIIEEDSVLKYGWKGIINGNIYNEKYLLDVNVLDSLKWSIIYKALNK